MQFSLVLATVDRSEELGRFLRHLDSQSCRDFELIIVDQNPDDRLTAILEPYRDSFPLFHLRTDRRGLSHARNIGIDKANGDILAFPDDDCWYPPDLLSRVRTWLEENPAWQGISGQAADTGGKTTLGRFSCRTGAINRYNIWRRMNSNTMFLRREAVKAAGKFDENLGVGAGTPWGAAEDIDFPLRVMQKNYRLFYDPEIIIRHPDPLMGYDEAVIRRAYSYSCGLGRVLRIHRYPGWYAWYLCIRPLGGWLLSLLSANGARARYHWNIFRGRVYGWHSNK